MSRTRPRERKAIRADAPPVASRRTRTGGSPHEEPPPARGTRSSRGEAWARCAPWKARRRARCGGQPFSRRLRMLSAMTETRNQKAPKAEYPATMDRLLVAEADVAATVAPASTDCPPLMTMGH